MPCWGRHCGSRRIDQESWCPCQGFPSGSHRRLELETIGNHPSGAPSAVVQVIHGTAWRVPYHSVNGVFSVVQCPTCRRVQEAQASLSFNREKPEDQKGTLPSPTARRGTVPTLPTASSQPFSSLMIWDLKTTTPKTNPNSEATSFPTEILFYLIEEEPRKPPWEPYPLFAHGRSLLGAQSPNAQLLARAVLLRVLAPLYCCQLFGAVFNDMFVSWIDYQLLLTWNLLLFVLS